MDVDSGKSYLVVGFVRVKRANVMFGHRKAVKLTHFPAHVRRWCYELALRCPGRGVQLPA